MKTNCCNQRHEFIIINVYLGHFQPIDFPGGCCPCLACRYCFASSHSLHQSNQFLHRAIQPYVAFHFEVIEREREGWEFNGNLWIALGSFRFIRGWHINIYRTRRTTTHHVESVTTFLPEKLYILGACEKNPPLKMEFHELKSCSANRANERAALDVN